MIDLVIIAFVLLTLVGFAFSAAFSGLETGLYTLNPVRLGLRAYHGEPSAVRIRAELRKPARLLTVLLIGTNASNYLGSYGLAEILHRIGFTDWPLIVLEAALFTPLLFVFAETLPKELFRTHTDRWTYWLSPLCTGARRLFTVALLLPIVQFVTTIVSRPFLLGEEGRAPARQRISQLIKEGVGAGVLSVSQTSVADRALAARDRRIGGLAIPWAKVSRLRADAGRAEREAVMNDGSFTRLPVVSLRGRVVGVLSWVDAVLDPERPTSALMQPPFTLTPDVRVLDAISIMRQHRRRLAVIVAPSTHLPVGLVTLKDLVEPITGDLAAW